MEFPENVIRIANESDENHPGDITAAIDEAEKRIRRLKNFEDLVNDLIRSAIQELIYNSRHRSNVRAKRETRQYGKGAKVSVGKSRSVRQIAESLYAFRIAGTALGTIRGEQLSQIAEKEQATAEGYLFNAHLCTRLAAIVPKDKTVRECVSERRLRSIFQEVRRKTDLLAG